MTATWPKYRWLNSVEGGQVRVRIAGWNLIEWTNRIEQRWGVMVNGRTYHGPVRSSAFHALTACFYQLGQIRRVKVCLRSVRIGSTLYSLVDFYFVTSSTWHAKIGAINVFWKHLVSEKSTQSPSCGTWCFFVLSWIDRDRRHDRKRRNGFNNCYIRYLNHAIRASWFIPKCTSWFLEMSVKKHASGASVARSAFQSRSTQCGRANRPHVEILIHASHWHVLTNH